MYSFHELDLVKGPVFGVYFIYFIANFKVI